MFASYFVVLATAAMSAYAQTLTSSLTMTAYQTLSKCDPTNPGKWLTLNDSGTWMGRILCLR